MASYRKLRLGLERTSSFLFPRSNELMKVATHFELINGEEEKRQEVPIETPSSFLLYSIRVMR